MSKRPNPPFRDIGDGYEWRAVVDADWTLVPDVVEGYQCLHVEHRDRCPNAAVAALMRPIMRYVPVMDLSGRTRRPYRYCAEHMYGRWIEGGTVLMWVVHKVGQ